MANFRKGDIVYYTSWDEDGDMGFRSGEVEGIDMGTAKLRSMDGTLIKRELNQLHSTTESLREEWKKRIQGYFNWYMSSIDKAFNQVQKVKNNL